MREKMQFSHKIKCPDINMSVDQNTATLSHIVCEQIYSFHFTCIHLFDCKTRFTVGGFLSDLNVAWTLHEALEQNMFDRVCVTPSLLCWASDRALDWSCSSLPPQEAETPRSVLEEIGLT